MAAGLNFSGFNTQNADQLYRNLNVPDTATIKNAVVENATIINATVENLNATTLECKDIISDSIVTNTITSDAFASPIANVTVTWNSGTVNVTNHSLIGTITATAVLCTGLECLFVVTNDNFSENDLILLSQTTNDNLVHFVTLFIIDPVNGSFTIRTTTTNEKKATGDVKIGYMIIKNTL